MKKLVSLVILFSFSLNVTASQTISIYLAAPLNVAVPEYNNPVVRAPRLDFLTSEPDSSLARAMRNLHGSEKSMSDEDAGNIIVSSMKASDEDLTGYIENQMGLSDHLVRERVKRALPRSLGQASYEIYRKKMSSAKRAVANAVGVTIMAGTAAVAIPLALTGIGLVPALMVSGIGADVAQATKKMLDVANAENRAILDQNISKVMVGVLGPEEAEAGAKVSFAKLSYLPIEEIVARLQRAAIAKKIMTGGVSAEVLKQAQDLYARDLMIAEILLSVLSRQVAGISVERMALTTALLGNRSTELLAALVFDLSEPERSALAGAVAAIQADPKPFRGGVGYRAGAEQTRDREILFTMTWLEGLLKARASGENFAKAEDLSTYAVEKLGLPAQIKNF